MTVESQADYARRHGVSPKTATMWKKSGLIVVTEEGVDVEASDERLRKYRDRHDGRAQRGAGKAVTQAVTQSVTQARRRKGNAAQGNEVTRGPVELALPEIRRRVRELDWKQPAPVTRAEQEERARMAAHCIGFEAVQSDLVDDGHWGGFQLRDPRWWGKPGACPDQEVISGFGFELTPLEVLRVCRLEAAPDDAQDWEDHRCTVDLRLLSALAYPHYPGQEPSGGQDEPHS